jgi:glucosamine-6-phosphate deaminase
MKHIVCQNAPEIAETVGQIFIDQVTQKKNSVLLLATGSSPIMTYQYIVKDYQSNHTD